MSEESIATPIVTPNGAVTNRDDVELVACAPSSRRLADLARRVALSD
jgi:hypothetical protein